MPSLMDRELTRLEGRPTSEGDNFRAGMWRRSYCVALNAVRSLEARLAASRRSSWDAPMTFFYPEIEPMICLEDEVRKLIAANPDKVEQTRTRPASLVGWWVGQVMKATNAGFQEIDVRRVVYEELFTR